LDNRSKAREVRKILDREKLSIRTWLDPDEVVSGLFGVSSLPTTFIFDTAGTLRWRHSGRVDDRAQELKKVLEGLAKSETSHSVTR
jgi:hypothetical protein